ncbi:MAG: undecaprenyldiphospho-muramoylpentapeptide beta-N-acetylglucosaminyltransferase [Nitrospirae bacterium]|nr:undecaprenyldiphospho-muramoylpentapeptide beta-N-acetylglucosaminyltransferase [Candidatus Troglogloeales bacterium]
MNVVITGGGTGGHLYPCLALANTFMKREAETEILFIGTATGIEARVVPNQGFQFKAILAQGFIGKPISGKVRSLFCIVAGIFQSIFHLKRFSPDLVIGIGGYTAGPVMMAAFFLRVKRVMLEPNLIPGMMNKVLAPFVHLTITAFEETRHFLRARNIACLGVPVRAEILGTGKGAESSARTHSFTLLVLGGSQGAHRINQALIQAIPFLENAPITILHQTGEKDWAEVTAAYKKYRIDARVLKFIENMAEAYTACDLVVSRAGAGTLSELAVAGLPSLLIPFPYAKGHQEKNAEPFVAAGAAEMILDKDLTGARIAGRILSWIKDTHKLSEMAAALVRGGASK